MAVAANPLPPGCPDGWPIKTTAQSGVQIIWGSPHSRQLPGHPRLRGIGIKMRPFDVSQYPEHSESWAGLYEQKLHELFWRFTVFSQPDRGPINMVMHLPMMGMPPREPTEKMMKEVRAGQKFSSFFKYATVFSANDIHNAIKGHEVCFNETTGAENRKGDDVVIRLPTWPRAPALEDSLYRRTENAHGFEFRTHLPTWDTSHDPKNVHPDMLWFIQLLPNELPSYHFWANPGEKPWQLTNNRKHIYGRGSPHYEDPGACQKQTMRSSPPNSRLNTAPQRPKASHPAPSTGSKRPRAKNNSSDSSSSGPTVKKARSQTPKPVAKGQARAATKRSKGKRG